MKNEQEDIESMFHPKALQEQNSRAFAIMDNNFGATLNRWQNKNETFNPAKANRSRINDLIDPSVTSGVASFSVESSERHNRLKPNITDEFLSKQFRGSNIFSESEKMDGRIP